MPRIGAPPHPARLWWDLSRPYLPIVAKLPVDFLHRQKLSRGAADPLCRIPEARTTPTRDPFMEMMERTNGLRAPKVDCGSSDGLLDLLDPPFISSM
jgi:hypothetical protein